MPGCVRLDYALPHHTRTREVAFGASWTLLSSLSSPHENREFTEERADGSEFSILRDCLLEHLGRFLFPSPRENREFVTRGWRGSEFSILRDCVFKSTSYASPCENRGFVDRGLGGAELVILREDFSGEGELLFHHSNLSSAIC